MRRRRIEVDVLPDTRIWILDCENLFRSDGRLVYYYRPALLGAFVIRRIFDILFAVV